MTLVRVGGPHPRTLRLSFRELSCNEIHSDSSNLTVYTIL